MSQVTRHGATPSSRASTVLKLQAGAVGMRGEAWPDVGMQSPHLAAAEQDSLCRIFAKRICVSGNVTGMELCQNYKITISAHGNGGIEGLGEVRLGVRG